MPYGSIKVDNIVFTNGGSDQTITVSGLVLSTSGNLTVTGTVSGSTIQGGTLVSGATVTGNTGRFTTLTGGTAGFTTITGTTVTGTTANFVSGVFTTQISGTTVTGTTANFTSGNFTNISGGTHAITSGVFASGTAANPSITFASDLNTGLYSPGADQVAISTNGTQRLLIDANGSLTAASATALVANFAGPANAYAQVTDGTGIFRAQLISNLPHIGAASNHSLVFTTNNTERMRLDSSGRLGLGGSSPQGRLHVWSLGAVSEPVYDAAGAFPGIVLNAWNNAASNFETVGDIISWSDKQGSPRPSQLRFFTAPNSANALPTQRMVIDNAGRLGLGVSSPAALLHVIGDTYIGNSLWAAKNAGNLQIAATQPYIYLRNKTAAVANDVLAKITVNSCESSGLYDDRNGAEIRFIATANAVNHQPTAITFATNDSASANQLAERMRLDSSGRLGLGTSSPGQKLEIAGETNPTFRITPNGQADSWSTSAEYGKVQWWNTDYEYGGGGEMASISAGVNNIYGGHGYLKLLAGPNGSMRFWTNSSERMRIDASGNVGIGTNPGAILDIGDPGSGLRFQNAASGNFNIGLLGGTSSTDAYVFNRANAPLIIGTNNQERGRWTSDGKLLVGTSTAVPASATTGNGVVQILGSGSTQEFIGRYSVDGSSSVLAFLKSRNATVGSHTIVQDGDDLGQINFQGSDGTNYVVGAFVRAQVDGTPGTNDMPGRLVFSTTSDSAASPTERLRITSDAYVRLAAGTGGIQFNGDTAAANALDDYEEGTWTPTQGAGLTLVGAYSSQGFYTKTGNTVVVFGSLFGATSIASSAAGILCGGLPFTPAPPTAGYVVGSMTNQAGNISNTCFSLNSTNAYGAVAVAANSGIHFTMTYRVA